MRILRSILAALLLAAAFVGAQAQQTAVILSGATATGAGTAVVLPARTKTYQAAGTTTAGSGSATVQVQCTLDGSNWDVLGTITLTLSTTSSSNSFASDDRCAQHRVNVSAISGTGAAVTVKAGM